MILYVVLHGLLPLCIIAGVVLAFRAECKAHGATWAGFKAALREGRHGRR